MSEKKYQGVDELKDDLLQVKQKIEEIQEKELKFIKSLCFAMTVFWIITFLVVLGL